MAIETTSERIRNIQREVIGPATTPPAFRHEVRRLPAEPPASAHLGSDSARIGHPNNPVTVATAQGTVPDTDNIPLAYEQKAPPPPVLSELLRHDPRAREIVAQFSSEWRLTGQGHGETIDV